MWTRPSARRPLPVAMPAGTVRFGVVAQELDPVEPLGVERANASSRGAVPTDWQPFHTGHCG